MSYHSTGTVIYDIETVENEIAHRYFTQEKKYKPAGNLRDPQKIKNSITEKRQKDLEQAALHWWSGKVICICADVINISNVPPAAFVGLDEKRLISNFFDWVLGLSRSVPNIKLIGKNGENFDRPFLIGRALVHDIGIPYFFRPYRPVEDIDQMFGFSSSRCGQIGSLADYAFGLQIETKTMTGSDVGDLYNQIAMGDASKWQDIASYCAGDVRITKELFARYDKSYTETAPEVPNVIETQEEIEIPFG